MNLEKTFNINHRDIETFLGDFAPEKFENPKQINFYFSSKNFEEMGFDIDEFDWDLCQRVEKYCRAVFLLGHPCPNCGKVEIILIPCDDGPWGTCDCCDRPWNMWDVC